MCQTPHERRLWFFLRNKKMGEVIKRQYSVGNYVLDFYCPAKKIAIELDGSQHNSRQNIDNDKYRTSNIEFYNIKVIRFWNFQIDQNLSAVLEHIWNELHN